MGASFRNVHLLPQLIRVSSDFCLWWQTGEITSLAGVDFLTISPALLEELKKSTAPVPKKLDATLAAKEAPIPKVSYVDNEPEFRWTLLQDSMAFDKLHEGIKKFAEDADTLRAILKGKLA